MSVPLPSISQPFKTLPLLPSQESDCGDGFGGSSAFIPTAVGRIMAPQDVLIPRTCAYVRLVGKGELRLLMGWLQDRKSGLDYPGGGPSIITRSYFHQEAKASVEEIRAQKFRGTFLVASCDAWIQAGRSALATTFHLLEAINSLPQPCPLFSANLNWSFVLCKWNNPFRIGWARNPFPREKHMQRNHCIRFQGNFWPPEVRHQVMKSCSVLNMSQAAGIKEERRENVFRESGIPSSTSVEELWYRSQADGWIKGVKGGSSLEVWKARWDHFILSSFEGILSTLSGSTGGRV